MKMLFKGLFIAFICVIIDQFTKIWVFDLLDNNGGPIEVLPFFNLVKVYNPGISFGMFNDIASGQVVFSGIALIITVALCIWLYKIHKNYLAIALGLIIGGAIGNVIDRLRLGAVADFLDFHIFDYHWPAFNVADSTIFIGVVIILIDTFIDDTQSKKGKKNGKKNIDN